jgi:hypothetical protein
MSGGQANQELVKQKAEDRKAAVSMWVTLSSQVIAATLAIIAIEGAFVTYVLDKRLPGPGFYILIVLSIVSLVFSILNGGVGISRLTVAGSVGRWGLKDGSPYFGKQSLACLVGVVLFFLALFFSGGTKEENQAKELKALQDKIQVIESRSKELSSQLDDIRSKFDSKSEELKPLEERINRLVEEVDKLKQGKE